MEREPIIVDEYGLCAAALVEAARAPDHPQHFAFCWDDTEAARRWREHDDRIRAVLAAAQACQDQFARDCAEVMKMLRERFGGGD